MSQLWSTHVNLEGAQLKTEPQNNKCTECLLGAISSIMNGRKVDLASVSYAKALIRKSYLPSQFQVNGWPHTQVHCSRYDISKEPRVSENWCRRVLGICFVGVFCVVFSFSHDYLSLRLWTLEQVIQCGVIKLMISLCTFCGFIETLCVLWDLPAFSRPKTEGSFIPF